MNFILTNIKKYIYLSLLEISNSNACLHDTVDRVMKKKSTKAISIYVMASENDYRTWRHTIIRGN